jgi:hypothetical protein
MREKYIFRHLYLQFRKLESIIFHVTFFPTLSCTCDADLPPTRNDYLQCYFPSIYTAIVFLSYFLEHFGGCFSCQSPDGLFFHAQEKRNPSTGSLNELEGKAQSRQDAAVKSGRELFHVLSQRVSMKISNISDSLTTYSLFLSQNPLLLLLVLDVKLKRTTTIQNYIFVFCGQFNCH